MQAKQKKVDWKYEKKALDGGNYVCTMHRLECLVNVCGEAGAPLT